MKIQERNIRTRVNMYIVTIINMSGAVKVRMRVDEIKKRKHYQPNEDGSKANFHTIEMSVVNTNDKNDPNYPYAQLSGGTKFPLCTINDEAAAMFEVGNDYDIVITPAEPAA